MIRDFPHTVCVEEMKTIVTVQEAERMDKKRKRTKGTLPDDGIRRYLYFAAIPVVVLILVVVILHSDKKKDAGQPEAHRLVHLYRHERIRICPGGETSR